MKRDFRKARQFQSPYGRIYPLCPRRVGMLLKSTNDAVGRDPRVYPMLFYKFPNRVFESARD
jgi:hypothetical protein